MKKYNAAGVMILIAVQVFLLSSCGTSASSIQPETEETPSGSPSALPSATATLTSTPAPTPTPVPVSIEEAIQRGTFAELEVFNKGRIDISPLSYTGQIIYLSTISPDGLQFAAVTKRGLYAYNAKSWQELFSAPLSPEVSITSINYSADGSLFAAGDSSGTITFWDTKTWNVQNSFQVHNEAITSLDIAPDNLTFVTIENQKEISVWNMSDGSLIKSQFRSKDAGPVYYSLDGKWLYLSEETTSRDLTVWDSQTLTLVNRLGQLGRRPPHQAVSPYTNTVAVAGFQTLTLHDFDKNETTRLKLDLERRDDPTHMMFLDAETLMLKFEYSEEYHLVDLESHSILELSLQALIQTMPQNPEFLQIIKSEEIKALGFEELGSIRNITPDGAVLILSGRDEIPSGGFDLSQKTMKNTAIQDFPWASSVFLTDGTLAGVDWTRPIRVPPFANKEQQGKFTITLLEPSFFVKSKIEQAYDLPDYIDTAAISPNGNVLAVGTADGNLYFWNLDTKELITTTRAHSKVVGMFGFYGAYSNLFFDEDGSHLATWGLDGSIKIYNMEDLSEVLSANGERPVFSPDGSHLAYVSSDKSIRLVPLLSEDAPRIFRGNINRIDTIAFSPDGTLLFSGDWNNAERQSTLQVWSISGESLLLDLRQYNPISSLLVSPDGTRLYMRTWDGVLSTWGHASEE